MRVSIHACKIKPERGFDIVLVTGDGRTLPDDVRTFLGWGIRHDVMAIGRSIKAYEGRVNHWVNVDGNESKWWAEHLPMKNGGQFPFRHTCGDCEGYDVDWDYEQPDYHYQEITGEPRTHGSSSLFSVLVALHLGYEKIVLAGCPLDTEGHWYFPQNKETLGPMWLGFDFMAWLDFAKMEEAKKVKSLSGYTAQIIGKATREWLGGE